MKGVVMDGERPTAQEIVECLSEAMMRVGSIYENHANMIAALEILKALILARIVRDTESQARTES
jgi:hypothetical protein